MEIYLGSAKVVGLLLHNALMKVLSTTLIIFIVRIVNYFHIKYV